MFVAISRKRTQTNGGGTCAASGVIVDDIQLSHSKRTLFTGGSSEQTMVCYHTRRDIVARLLFNAPRYVSLFLLAPAQQGTLFKRKTLKATNVIIMCRNHGLNSSLR